MEQYNPYSDPGYVQAKQGADTAMQQYGTAAANTQTMPDMLKRVLDQKFSSQNNPLFAQQEQAGKDYFNSLDTGYQAVTPEQNSGMIFSPQAQQEQIQGKRNSLLAALASVNQMIGGGFGGIENVIGEATKTYQAQEMAAKFKAESARQKVEDLFREIAAKEEIRQFNEELALAKQKEANSSSGETDLATLMALLAAMQGEGEGQEGEVDLSAAIEEDTPAKQDYKLNLNNAGAGLTMPGISYSGYGYAPGNNTLTTQQSPKKKSGVGTDYRSSLKL